MVLCIEVCQAVEFLVWHEVHVICGSISVSIYVLHSDCYWQVLAEPPNCPYQVSVVDQWRHIQAPIIGVIHCCFIVTCEGDAATCDLVHLAYYQQSQEYQVNPLQFTPVGIDLSSCSTSVALAPAVLQRLCAQLQ